MTTSTSRRWGDDPTPTDADVGLPADAPLSTPAQAAPPLPADLWAPAPGDFIQDTDLRQVCGIVLRVTQKRFGTHRAAGYDVERADGTEGFMFADQIRVVAYSYEGDLGAARWAALVTQWNAAHPDAATIAGIWGPEQEAADAA